MRTGNVPPGALPPGRCGPCGVGDRRGRRRGPRSGADRGAARGHRTRGPGSPARLLRRGDGAAGPGVRAGRGTQRRQPHRRLPRPHLRGAPRRARDLLGRRRGPGAAQRRRPSERGEHHQRGPSSSGSSPVRAGRRRDRVVLGSGSRRAARAGRAVQWLPAREGARHLRRGGARSGVRPHLRPACPRAGLLLGLRGTGSTGRRCVLLGRCPGTRPGPRRRRVVGRRPLLELRHPCRRRAVLLGLRRRGGQRACLQPRQGRGSPDRRGGVDRLGSHLRGDRRRRGVLLAGGRVGRPGAGRRGRRRHLRGGGGGRGLRGARRRWRVVLG